MLVNGFAISVPKVLYHGTPSMRWLRIKETERLSTTPPVKNFPWCGDYVYLTSSFRRAVAWAKSSNPVIIAIDASLLDSELLELDPNLVYLGDVLTKAESFRYRADIPLHFCRVIYPNKKSCIP